MAELKESATLKEAVKLGFKLVRPMLQLTILHNFISALQTLQEYVEADGTGELLKRPLLQFDYDIQKLTEEEKAAVEGDIEKAVNKLFEKKFPEAAAWAQLTQGVYRIMGQPHEGGSPATITIAVPKEKTALTAELENLSEEDREKKLKSLARGWDISEWVKPSFSLTAADGTIDLAADIVFHVFPLTYTHDRARAFFPVWVGLNFTKGGLAALTKEDRSEFWRVLIGTFAPLAAGPITFPTTPRKPDQVNPIPPENFHVAAGFAPMHRLAERNRGGRPLFPEERRQFYDLRTPLNWAVGLAFFARTSEKAPGDWQEVTLADLQSRVYSLTERQARRHGQQREDILAEVVKLHSAKNFYVRYEFERLGRFYRRNAVLGSDYAIPNLELVFRDRKKRRVYPSDPALQSVTIPLEVKGRRVYTPDGKDIKALPKDRFKLYSIRWRWNPSFVDDLKAAPLLDQKGKVKKDNTGRPLRGGYNIQVAVRIFKTLATLRNEKAYVAHDLLILLAHDIQKPPKQSQAARNVIEKEANRLFDLLGLEEDPKAPGRREEIVAAAIYRLKQPDIGALLPGSDERPRPSAAADRRKSPFYRLVRSSDFMPAAALVTKEEAAELKAETVQPILPPPPKKPAPEVAVQKVLPGITEDPPVPSGADIRAARAAAGITLREFAHTIGGGSFNTWARYERGEAIRAGKIGPETWQKVRDFVKKHMAKGGA